MGEKRYYWLRFKDDFFDSKRIKKLRRMAGGDTYVIIYLKMQLKAIRTDGMLEYTGIEPDFVDELALDLDESPDDVRMTLAFLMTYGLCECSDNIHYFLPYVVENIGSETASTQRVRDYRERQKALQCNADVTQVKRICNAEKDKEKDKEIEIESKKDNNTDFETFWDAYPKKKSKGTARKAFAKALQKTSLDNIMNALHKMRESREWTKDDGQYVPYPATWLNGEGWDDEVKNADGLDSLRELYELALAKDGEEHDKG